MRKSGVAQKNVGATDELQEVEAEPHPGSTLTLLLVHCADAQLTDADPWNVLFEDDIVVCDERAGGRRSREVDECLSGRGVKVSGSRTGSVCSTERPLEAVREKVIVPSPEPWERWGSRRGEETCACRLVRVERGDRCDV